MTPFEEQRDNFLNNLKIINDVYKDSPEIAKYISIKDILWIFSRDNPENLEANLTCKEKLINYFEQLLKINGIKCIYEKKNGFTNVVYFSKDDHCFEFEFEDRDIVDFKSLDKLINDMEEVLEFNKLIGNGKRVINEQRRIN